jgi:hypothetical protein
MLLSLVFLFYCLCYDVVVCCFAVQYTVCRNIHSIANGHDVLATHQSTENHTEKVGTPSFLFSIYICTLHSLTTWRVKYHQHSRFTPLLSVSRDLTFDSTRLIGENHDLLML